MDRSGQRFHDPLLGLDELIVEPTQRHNNTFNNDDWAYRLAASLQHLDPVQENSTHPNSSTQPGNEIPMAAIKGKKVAKPKKVSRRSVGFTKEEDGVICSGFLNVSKDPIIGVNQSSGGYYKRIHDYFNEHKPESSHRSQIAIQHRWTSIQKSVNIFCGHKSVIDRRNESGKNEQERIEDAVTLYEKVEPFTFMHCWKILRNEPKWNDRLIELNTRDLHGKTSQPSQANYSELHVESGNDNCEVPRPEGRDSAKRRKSRAAGDVTSSTTAVEVLERLNERSEKSEVKQEQQMEDILNMKGNKVKLAEMMYDLHKQDMEARTKLKEEQLSLTKKDIEVREKQSEAQLKQSEAQLKQSEAQLLTAEIGIMGIDLDKLAQQF